MKTVKTLMVAMPILLATFLLVQPVNAHGGGGGGGGGGHGGGGGGYGGGHGGGGGDPGHGHGGYGRGYHGYYGRFGYGWGGYPYGWDYWWDYPYGWGYPYGWDYPYDPYYDPYYYGGYGGYEGYAGYGGQNVQKAPPVSQPLVREGNFAIKLVEVLKLGTAKNEAEAESRLASIGIAPKNGWIANYPLTPDIIGELRRAIGLALDSGKIAMNKDEALMAVQILIDNQWRMPVARH
jgi:hypothetical protein